MESNNEEKSLEGSSLWLKKQIKYITIGKSSNKKREKYKKAEKFYLN